MLVPDDPQGYLGDRRVGEDSVPLLEGQIRGRTRAPPSGAFSLNWMHHRQRGIAGGMGASSPEAPRNDELQVQRKLAIEHHEATGPRLLQTTRIGTCWIALLP